MCRDAIAPNRQEAEGFRGAEKSCPGRIGRAESTFVAAIPEHASVATLLEAAPSLVRAGWLPDEDVRRHTLDVIRVAALKGFVRLDP